MALPIFATSILIFLAFILVFFFVKEPERKVKRKAAGVGELLNLVKYKPFMQGAISGMLYYYGFFVVLAYSPLIMHLSAIQLGFVFCGWGLALAYGSAILAHKLEGKYEPKTLLKRQFTRICAILNCTILRENYVVTNCINCSIRISIRIK